MSISSIDGVEKNIFHYEEDKFSVSCEIRFQLIYEIIRKGKIMAFPTFSSHEDPNLVPFHIQMRLANIEDVEEDDYPATTARMKCYLHLINDSPRPVFIYQAKITLFDWATEIIETDTKENMLISEGKILSWDMWTLLFKQQAEDDTSKRFNGKLICEWSYGPTDKEPYIKIKSDPISTWVAESEIQLASSPPEDSLSQDWLSLFESEAEETEEEKRANSELQKAEEADLVFFVGGDGDGKSEQLKAHKIVLTTRSPYFRRMFASEMREAVTKEIHIPHVEAETFREFLKYLYCGLISDETLEHPSMAASMLALADQYGVESLNARCEKRLVQTVDADNVIDTTVLADIHGCPRLRKFCLDWIKQNFPDITEVQLMELKKYPDLMVDVLVHVGNE